MSIYLYQFHLYSIVLISSLPCTSTLWPTRTSKHPSSRNLFVSPLAASAAASCHFSSHPAPSDWMPWGRGSQWMFIYGNYIDIMEINGVYAGGGGTCNTVIYFLGGWNDSFIPQKYSQIDVIKKCFKMATLLWHVLLKQKKNIYIYIIYIYIIYIYNMYIIYIICVRNVFVCFQLVPGWFLHVFTNPLRH